MLSRLGLPLLGLPAGGPAAFAHARLAQRYLGARVLRAPPIVRTGGAVAPAAVRAARASLTAALLGGGRAPGGAAGAAGAATFACTGHGRQLFVRTPARAVTPRVGGRRTARCCRHRLRGRLAGDRALLGRSSREDGRVRVRVRLARRNGGTLAAACLGRRRLAVWRRRPVGRAVLGRGCGDRFEPAEPRARRRCGRRVLDEQVVQIAHAGALGRAAAERVAGGGFRPSCIVRSQDRFWAPAKRVGGCGVEALRTHPYARPRWPLLASLL
eukprot:scaffold7751_cov73-Isochrysis_galbana.AAC.1